MHSVQIAELKNKLSAYLNFVRAGQEVIVRDRSIPIAKIVPLNLENYDEEEQSLVAAGLLKLPEKLFDVEAFLAAGKEMKGPKISNAALRRAINFAREDASVSVLGRKRPRTAVRTRTKK